MDLISVGRSRRVQAAVATALLLGCSGGGESLSEAAQRGQRTYQNVCIACHAPDPSVDGTLGPAIAGSSLELIEGRVLRNEYPPGYTPKRNSTVMPVFPYLEDKLPDLAAYLAEAKK